MTGENIKNPASLGSLSMTGKWRWPNFSIDEFKCKHCGEHVLDDEFMDKLQALRVEYGKPMKVTSGYRCPEHNSTVSSTGYSGPHTTGRAVDIACAGLDAYNLVYTAIKHGFTGIGIAQKGPHESRFIHLDTLMEDHARPWLWTYA